MGVVEVEGEEVGKMALVILINILNTRMKDCLVGNVSGKFLLA